MAKRNKESITKKKRKNQTWVSGQDSENIGEDLQHLREALAVEQLWVILEDDDRLVSDESDLASLSDKLRLISIQGDSEDTSDAEMVKSDEELVRMLQAEEDAMMLTVCYYTR